MTRLILGPLVCLMTLPAAAQPNLDYVLDRIEEHYNRAKTLRVSFTETYTAGGRGRKTESGELYLRKPGRMRWDYRDPMGKLFISDGKNLYLYTPASNRAEKMKLKETDDLRAPMAFLLGKLDFHRDFTGFQMKQAGTDINLVVSPKSDRLPYKRVDFTVNSNYQITRMNVLGHDNSVLAFTFTNETLNPQIADTMFRFKLPTGAQFVDTSEPVSSAAAKR